MYIACRSPIWVMREGANFIEKRLLTLFLDAQKLRNFLISVKNAATVDALWCVYTYYLYQVIDHYVSLQLLI